MDHSVCNMKAILAVAVLAMAAFAGVMIVGDDADAAEGDCTFKVGSTTYTINIPSDAASKTIFSNFFFSGFTSPPYQPKTISG